MSAVAVIVAAFAAGCAVERIRGRHRLAQIVDVEAVRAATIDTGQLEAQLAEQTLRAAQFHRWWRITQQAVREQAEILASVGRRPIPLGPGPEHRRARHLRSAMPHYGVHRSPA